MINLTTDGVSNTFELTNKLNITNMVQYSNDKEMVHRNDIIIADNNRLAMADCSTYEECMEAERIGFDCVSTTLCGYTSDSKNIDGPDLELIKKVADTGMTMIVVSHEMNFVKKCSSRVLFIDNGKIALDGTPKEVFSNKDNERLREFLNKTNN